MPKESIKDQPPETPAPAEPQCVAPGAVAPNEVQAQLTKILDSEAFRRSPQLSRFLSYLVDDALENQGGGAKEYEIGRQAFNRPESFDVRLDPIVRVEARRLRSRLAEYYADVGSEDPVLIDLGPRGYRPSFSIRPAVKPEAKSAAAGVAALDQGTAVAVMPFVDLTESGDLGYFCDGLTEELIHALTGLPGLLVASRSSSFQFRGTGQDVRQARATLGVTAVIEGSVRRQGNRLRVTAQLHSADTGFNLWSETYDIELEDLFEVQERIAQSIVETLRKAKRQFSPGILLRKQTEQPAAYRSFLAGMQLQSSFREADLLKSEKLLTAAVEADPGYATALAMLARTRAKLVWREWRAPGEGWPLVKSSAEGALQLDGAHSTALAALGSVRALGDWNWPQGELAFARALENGANEALVHRDRAMHYLVPLRRLDEALAAVVATSPDSLEAWIELGWIRLFRGEIHDATKDFQSALESRPGDTEALLGLARCHIEHREPREALAALSAVSDNCREQPRLLAAKTQALALAGRALEAEALYRSLCLLPTETAFIHCIPAAQAAIALDRFPEALEHLQTAVRLRCPKLVELDVDPVYRPLHRRSLTDPIRIAVCLAPAQTA